MDAVQTPLVTIVGSGGVAHYTANESPADFGSRDISKVDVLPAIWDFFNDDVDQLLKLVRDVTRIVSGALMQAGKVVESQRAMDVAGHFSAAGRYLKLVGAPVCLLTGFYNLAQIAGKDGAVKLLDAAKNFADAAYAAKDAIEILSANSLSLVAQKVVELVSMFGGLLSPILGIAKASIDLSRASQIRISKEVVGGDGSPILLDINGAVTTEKALVVRTLREDDSHTATGVPEELYVREYNDETRIVQNMENAKNAAKMEASFKIIKNVFYLAMSIIGVLAVLASITMAPTVSLIVMSVLSIGGIIFSAASYVAKAQAAQHRTAAYIAGNNTYTLKKLEITGDLSGEASAVQSATADGGAAARAAAGAAGGSQR